MSSPALLCGECLEFTKLYCVENALIEFTKFCCVENALIEFSAPSWGVIMQLAEFFVFSLLSWSSVVFSLWRWLCCNSLGLFSPTQDQLLVGLVCVRVELGKGLDTICCSCVDALDTSGQGWTAHRFVRDCTFISVGG